jgi:NTP pyrophosphatase (non-canonical NTP hydrolase)
MLNMDEKDIYRYAIKTFGVDTQEMVAVEELAELSQAIVHKRRGRQHNIAEEIADVEIMLEQLKIINLCHSEVERIKEQKLVRLYKRIFNLS